MAPRFTAGATAYTKDGRSYIVDDVEDGIVYCRTTGGAETEFAESALFTEAEWISKSDGRRDSFYGRLKQSKAYSTPIGKPDRAAAQAILSRVEKLSPGILDFTAYTVASRASADFGDHIPPASLSILKCREVFDESGPDVRLGLLAGLLGMKPEALIDAGRLGDNLMRALIDKGMAAHAEAFEEFCDRPRR